MVRNGYRALLVDCDGTLAPANMKVTLRVRTSVQELAKRLPVCIVSSRDHHDIGTLATSLGLTAPQVSEGGARIFDPATGQTLWRRTLEPDDARAIAGFLHDSGLEFSAVDGAKRVRSQADIAEWDMTRVTATSLTPTQAQEIAARFGEWPTVHTALIIRTDNGHWMVDFTHAEVTKASAAQRLAALLGAEPSQLIAAGDSFNDLPLLQACGLRIAMGNAVPELKAIADYIAPTTYEDGLATAIDEFVMPAVNA
ncbi:MAG: HAD-IIB family hydrolase [SAR202 cluster bacterium]|nr:HAD-IIB family hydrolase [SAR202 cluster bacterium]